MAYLPTIITSSPEAAIRAMHLIEEVRKNPIPGEARILGIHLEGPSISFEKRGVHPIEHLALLNLDHMKRLLAAGQVKEVTVAPELPGVLDLIKFLVDEGILISLGHSAATLEEAEAGFNAGARTVTHLFNGMHRPPFKNLAQVALEREDVIIQIIVDAVHVPKDLLAETLPRIMNRFIVTNDTVAAAGIGNGTFPFGDMEITISNGEARRTDGTLAGGIGTLNQSLQMLKELGVSDEIALSSVTTRPALNRDGLAHSLQGTRHDS